jgi:hypothetical protein
MAKLLLELKRPYLTPIEADEIRAEGMLLRPKLCFVMADWPWLELRGLTEKRAEEFLEKLEARGVRFRVLEEAKKKKARAA